MINVLNKTRICTLISNKSRCYVEKEGKKIIYTGLIKKDETKFELIYLKKYSRRNLKKIPLYLFTVLHN